MDEIIKVENLCKKYGNFSAVDNISFSVKRGELFAFLGTNGAGKSTTIRMISTLLSKSSGYVTVDGFEVNDNPNEIRKRLGVIFQDNVLDALLTVKENLLIRAKFIGLKDMKLEKQLENLKIKFELEGFWNRPFGKLSGGQKRKCEIARALLGNPKILILDEPTTGLDPQSRKAIWKLIKEMQVENNMTVFLTTHYMEEAASADNVIILEQGIIRASGTPTELKNIYGQDTLKIRFNNEQVGRTQLMEVGVIFEQATDVFLISVNNSLEALKLLNLVESNMKDFELIKGTMDDVFLTVTNNLEVPNE